MPITSRAYPDMNTPKARQAAFNASSSGQWEGFSGHRQAVTSLLEDPVRAAVMGAAGRARAVADFSWDAIAGRTIEVYRSVL